MAARSVGSTHTAFATECFLDEIARETKKDPFELRRALLEQAATEGLSVRALRSQIDRELGLASPSDRRARESERAEIGAKLDALRTRLEEIDAAEIDETRRAAVARSIDELLALL